MIKKSDWAIDSGSHVLAILKYLIFVSVAKFMFRILDMPTYDNVFSYINVGIMIFVVGYYVSKFKVVLDYETLAAVVILFSSFLFTSLSKSLISSILAVGINIFLLYTSVVCDNLVVREDTVAKLCKMVVCFSLVVILISIIKDNPLSQLVSLQNAYDFNFFGLWNSKNQFGRFLFSSAVCNVFLIIYNQKHNMQKKFYYFSFVLIAFCIVISFSRAALLALIVFGLICFLCIYRKHLLRNIIILAILGLVGMFLYNIDSINNFVNSLVIRTDTANIDNRSVLWKVGLNYFKDHIFIGAGEYMAEGILGASGSKISEFHNGYVNRLVVSGLPVFCLYAFLYIKRFYVFYKKRVHNEYIFISFGLLVALLVYMFFESFAVYTFTLDAYITMFFLYLVPNMRLNDE